MERSHIVKAMPIRRHPTDPIWVECSVEEATHIKMLFPIEHPALRIRYLPIQLSGSRADTGNWSWNGDVERPTVKPSILVQTVYGEKREPLICHTFVNDGIVQFLHDSSHELAGQSLPLLNIE